MTTLQRPGTLTAAVTAHIRDAIVHGDYSPGSPLPEIRLAEELGTSRGTVREALHALEDQSLVEVVPHKGSFVSRVSRRTARETYSLRAVLEGYAVRLTIEAGLLEDGGNGIMEQRLADLEEAAASDDVIATIEAERAFHRELWSHCGNEQLLVFMGTLQVQTRRLLMYKRAFDPDPEAQIASHRKLAAVILSGSPDQAEAAIRDHVLDAAKSIVAKMPEDSTDR